MGDASFLSVGHSMHRWATDLFPICRSLTGNGVRETLSYIQGLLPELTVLEVESNTKVFDWEVPCEWNITEAFITNEDGTRIIDFKRNNLHLVGYSEPVDRWLTLDELQSHLHSLPDQPKAIPYVTSYYERTWGFCLSHEMRQSLKPGYYHVLIDSSLEAGHLSYGELILPGRENEEVFLSTYICHPSMANNELSGPVVLTALAQWLLEKNRNKTYRIVFVPETIGSLVYLSRNLEVMKERTIAGFLLTCIGDERAYSWLESRLGDTLADRVTAHVMKHLASNHTRYKFLDGGSDERQYCSPGIELPVVSLMRSKYHSYPEYHTSLDDLSLITPQGLWGGLEMVQKCIELLEINGKYQMTCLGDPQLGKRGLYPNLSTSSSWQEARTMMQFISYSDGRRDLVEIAEKIGVYAEDCVPIIKTLTAAGLLKM